MSNLKWAGTLVGSGAALMLVLTILFGTAQSSFECAGITMPKAGLSERATLFIKLVEYRPWIVWAKSDGAMHMEIPNRHIEYFSHVMRVGDQFQVFDSHQNPKMKGHFSALSHALSMEIPDGYFEGSCKEKR